MNKTQDELGRGYKYIKKNLSLRNKTKFCGERGINNHCNYRFKDTYNSGVSWNSQYQSLINRLFYIRIEYEKCF